MFSFSQLSHLFVIFIFSIQTVNSSSPKLTEFYRTQAKNVGTKLRLYCSIEEGSKPVQFEWFWNGNSVGKNGKILLQHSDESSVLMIDQLDSSDSGNYSCVVKNLHGSDDQFTILTVKGLFISSVPIGTTL